jgi:aminomethyltransferase
MNDELKKTALHQSALDSGGKMVPFSGWEMPVQFEGLIKEHKTVRESCGMFDISHMGSLRLIGENVKDKLQYLVPTDLDRLTVGKACYSVLMNDEGGIRDDLIIYDRGDNEVVVVINACCLESDTEWIKSQLEPEIEVIDYKKDGVFLAVQGKDAIDILEKSLDVKFNLPTRFSHQVIDIFDDEAFVARTGYTGEDGVEILIPTESGIKLWNKLLENGVAPCGLGCRDTLRLEAGMHLYGSEMDTTITPYEASLGWIVNAQKPYIGKSILDEQKKNGIDKKLVAITLTKRNIARHDYPVMDGDKVIGKVTSGTWSPSLSIPIALAYVPTELSKVGDKVHIKIRGKLEEATVVKKPFYS